jgi:chromatin segregation and condensation protein Rec8/ScpA/Scc1 (kleisin family)
VIEKQTLEESHTRVLNSLEEYESLKTQCRRLKESEKELNEKLKKAEVFDYWIHGIILNLVIGRNHKAYRKCQ